MKAIQTKILPQTTTKPTRIKAFEPDGKSAIFSVEELSLNCSGGIREWHGKAARLLADKHGWKGALIGGWLKDSMVWVFME